jgi:type I pantothenate kinase
VAVGKSTTARVLQALLSRWPNHPKVALVTTDGFLHPNAVLQERDLMQRKGFPESYDGRRLVTFLGAIKSGEPTVRAPVYSHIHYDVLEDQFIELCAPDIVIIEGLNVLQAHPSGHEGDARPVVSDFFDFSIYVDAGESLIREWFFERFMMLRATAFQDQQSYFHRYGAMSENQAVDFAHEVWQNINAKNLRENILPTRERAKLILEKGPDHSIVAVHLRKL